MVMKFGKKKNSMLLWPFFRLADLIEEHKTALANLEVLDNGKPFAEADFDIQCSIDTFRYFAGWCDKIHGNTIPAGKHSIEHKIKWHTP